jgi:ABC-2 type transport system permease protein
VAVGHSSIRRYWSMKYFRLFWIFFRTNLIATLEYRINLVTQIFSDVAWYLGQILVFETLYSHTQNIGEFNHAQGRVFLGILFVSNNLYNFLFASGLDHLGEMVRKGELDFLLTKPVNSQFMMSLGKISPLDLISGMISWAWLIWSLFQIPELNPLMPFWLILIVPCGSMIIYSIKFFFATTSFLFTRAENLSFMWYQFYKLGMRPDSIYAPALRFVLLTIIPVGLFASLPARMIMEPFQPFYFFHLGSVTFLLFLGTGKFWKYALTKYTSASS